MKKLCRVFLMFACVCLWNGFAAIGVHADEMQTGYVEFSEEDRYQPKYYQPLHSDRTAYRMQGRDAMGQIQQDLLAGLQNHAESIDLSKYQLSKADLESLSECFYQILNNCAELFYVEGAFSYTSSNNMILSFRPKYFMNEQQARQTLQEMDAVAKQAVDLVSDQMEDYEKALVVHDWLATYCEYDYENFQANNVPDVSHRPDGALLHKIAVCDGYAKAYMYIMDNKLGIPCHVISSDSMAHAWNMLQIDGQYYHVDVTYDDPAWDSIGRVTHNNFLRSDQGIQQEDHYGWESAYTADDTAYDDALWQDRNSRIVYFNGYWYYTEFYAERVGGAVRDPECRIMKTGNIKDGGAQKIHSFTYWTVAGGSLYTSTFSYPQLYRNKLIFNGPKAIYSMSLLTEKVTTYYTPKDIPADTADAVYSIYGFKIEGDTMYYAVQPSASLHSSQKPYIKSAPCPRDALSGSIAIHGEPRYGEVLTAEIALDEAVGDGLQIVWCRQEKKDDKIKLIELAQGETYQVQAADIGYALVVLAMHEDDSYDGYLTETLPVIQKAVPVPPAVTEKLYGVYGQALSTVTPLPAGYRWKEPAAVMQEIGNQSFAALYCPDDALYEQAETQIVVQVACGVHIWDDGTVTKSPTCVQKGIETYTCTVCGEKRTEEIAATGNHTWDEGTVTKEPTCTAAGTKTYTCTVCRNETKTEALSALGHQNTENRNQTEATCVEAGYTGDTYCKDCGSKIADGQEIAATGIHTWDEGSVIKAPTCTEQGEKTASCLVCGTKETQELAALGHQHTEVRNQKAATCAASGYTGDTYCKDCGSKVAAGQTVAATGNHIWDAGTQTKAPTNTENGIMTYLCTVCQTARTEAIPAVSVPNAGSNQQTETLKKGGTFEYGNLLFKVTAAGAKNGTVELIGVKGTKQQVKIPATVTFDGITYQVTSIGAKALKNNKHITKLVIGANVKKIGKEAFSGCKKLKDITIQSKQLKSVGKNAIKNIHKKASIKCPAKQLAAYKKLFSAKTGFKKATMKCKK